MACSIVQGPEAAFGESDDGTFSPGSVSTFHELAHFHGMEGFPAGRRAASVIPPVGVEACSPSTWHDNEQIGVLGQRLDVSLASP